MEFEILKENFNKTADLMTNVFWLNHDLSQILFQWNKHWRTPIHTDEDITFDTKYKNFESKSEKYQEHVKSKIQYTVESFLEQFDQIEKEIDLMKQQIKEMKELNN